MVHLVAIRPQDAGLALATYAGCGGPPAPDLVVYAALDGEFSEPILEDFGKEHGLNVAPKFDTEAYKTVGLYRAIVEERSRPRCDVFWNNEILGTLRLQEQGLLQAYESPLAWARSSSPTRWASSRIAHTPKRPRKLIDYLLSAEVEKRLAEGDSAQIPLATNVEAKVRVETPATTSRKKHPRTRRRQRPPRFNASSSRCFPSSSR